MTLNSGVTRVGVIGAATDGVTPFFLKKTDALFLVIALCKVMTFFLAVVSSQLPPSDVICTVFFLNSATFLPRCMECIAVLR